jgi:S1-C subfamily serine protease
VARGKEEYIVTNRHVIEDCQRTRVQFPKGTTTKATILGRDPANDPALIKVDPEIVAGVEPVQLTDSTLVHTSQLAFVIGDPFQMEGTVTAGVVSGINRSLPSDLGHSITGKHFYFDTPGLPVPARVPANPHR